MPGLYFDGKYAYPTGYHPYYLHRIIQCANALVNMPYKFGGGHASLVDTGYDCSGSLSYVLCGSGFLRRPMASTEFGHFGQPGTGLYMTIYVRPGVHVFMTAVRSHFTPDIVRVKEGETVHFHITNVEQAKDATHGFAIGSYNINLSLEPGEHANVSFVADKSGVYPLYCTEFCSALHLEMAGYFLVEGLSSNTHDRSLEAAMTGAFVVGPLFAVVAFIIVFAKVGKAGAGASAP